MRVTTPDPTIRSEDTVEQTLDRFPLLAAVFVRRGMACPGCDMAAFETLADAARAYDEEPAHLLAELAAAALAENCRVRGTGANERR